MSEFDWNNIASIYEVKLPKGVRADPIIREMESRMLELLSMIKESPCILQCRPGSAHQTLTIRPSGAQSAIHVFWVGTGYQIALDPFVKDPSQQKRMLASPEEVISVLENYVIDLEKG